MRELVFSFQDLPAFTELGFGFGSFQGEADIRYDRNGEWSIGEIRLEGSRWCNPNWETKRVALCEKSHRELFLSLFDQLENGEWKDKIDGEVIEALEAEGISIIPDWREHSTLHRAAQGV